MKHLPSKAGMRVYDSVLDIIGETPMLRLPHAEVSGGATLWAKAEHLNPGGSIKDRICLAMIEAAEASGVLKPGMTVVEPTSGNTGIGLSLVCARKGYPLVLTMPKSMSLERRALLGAYGAEIVLTDPERVMEGAIEEAIRIKNDRGAFMPMQFENIANPEIHEKVTAQEILRSCNHHGIKTVDAFVAAVGTGGTITGVGRALKRVWPSIRLIAVEPKSSPVLSGGEKGPSKIQGLNAGFVPANFDPTVPTEIMTVSDQDAYNAKTELAHRAGLLVGMSAGANVFVSQNIARQLGEQGTVITVLCDTGERYFSLDTYFQK